MPKYMQAFIDRNGKPRHYIRRRGYPRTALPGMPWSPTFMAAYEEVMAKQDTTPTKAAHIKAGSLRALAVSYMSSGVFRNLKGRSQETYRGIIERFCKTKDANGNLYADKPFAGMDRRVLVKILAARADNPHAANELLKVLRLLMRHAVEQGWRKDNPARDVKPFRYKTKGHHSWTEDDISRFESQWPFGTRERLALALLLYTGQRGLRRETLGTSTPRRYQ